MLGTFPYMSPEQTYGKTVDAVSDIYSLGVLFYQLLTGRLPFQGNPSEMLEGIRHSEPPRPGDIRAGLDAELEGICLQAMSKDPNTRYQSAEELADAIRAYLEAAMRGGDPPRPNRRTLWFGGAAAAIVLLLAILLIFEAGRGRTNDKPSASDNSPVAAAASEKPASSTESATLPVGRWIETPPRAVVTDSRRTAKPYTSFL